MLIKYSLSCFHSLQFCTDTHRVPGCSNWAIMCERQCVSGGSLHTWGVAESSDLFSDAKNLLNDAQVAYQWIYLLFLCLQDSFILHCSCSESIQKLC